MKVVILMLLIVLIPLTGYSQQTIQLSGKVTASENNTPLVYASITLKGSSAGTVTNAEGSFELLIPSTATRDTLVISMLGYDSRRESILSRRDFNIQLKIKPIQLEEVVVTDVKINLTEIVKKAYRNIDVNYPVEPYVYQCFYRETHLENNRNVMLVEASLGVYDEGYQAAHLTRHHINEKVNLRNVRASKSYRNPIFKNTPVENFNLVISALSNNHVKYRINDSRSLNSHKYTLDTILYSNDHPVYVISFFTYIKRYPNFERKNTLYIDAGTYAIYKYNWEEYAKKGKYSELPWRLTKDSTYISNRVRISTTYEYEPFQGKMYLKYFDEKCWDEIYNAKGDSVAFESLGHTSLILTGIEMGQNKFDDQSPMKDGKSLHAQTTPYDAAFWQRFKPAVPLTKQEIRDLEKEVPLEEQFRNESKPK